MRQPIRLLACAVVALCGLWVFPTAGHTQSHDGRYELTWFFVTMTRAGPIATEAPERTPFVTEANCAAFGARMTPRMEDWVRGLVRADWEHPVGVRFRCAPAGKPT
jgi:hypothetical protein